MKSKLLATFVGLTLVITTLTVGPVAAGTLDMGIGPGQSEIDNEIDGGWHNSQIGVAGRPFIVEATLDGDSIFSSDNAPGTESPVGSWRVLVNPNNVCHDGQEPAEGVCYADPNRVSIDLAYSVNGDNKHDFSGNSLDGLGVTEDSEFEFVIDLNAMAGDLGWTWVNGVPTYWGFENDDQVRLKVHPAYKPSNHQIANQCSTISTNVMLYILLLHQPML